MDSHDPEWVLIHISTPHSASGWKLLRGWQLDVISLFRLHILSESALSYQKNAKATSSAINSY